MAKKTEAVVEIADVSVEAVKEVKAVENTTKKEKTLKKAYNAQFKNVRKARTNLAVYKTAGGDDIVGVFVKDKKAQLTGYYVELDGDTYFEVESAKFKGFIKGLEYLW